MAIKIVRKIDEIAYYISKASMIFCGVLLVGVTLMIFGGVLNRVFSLWTWLFVEEWSSLLLIPMSYLAFGYTLRWNKHLKMDLLTQKMSIKWQNIMAVFAAVFSLLCLYFMLQFSKDWFDYCIERTTVSSGPMKTPLWFFSLSIYLSMILLSIDMFLFLINRIIYMRFKIAPLNFFDQIGKDDIDEERCL